METFNRSRYAIVVRRFLETAGDIAPIVWVNARESVWIQCGKPFVNINFGVPLSSIASTNKELERRLESAAGDRKTEPTYLLAVVRDSSRHYNINVVLSSESTVKDHMEAMFHAFLLEAILLKLRVNMEHPWASDIADVENAAEDLSSDDHRLFQSSRAMVNKCFPLLWKALEASEWETSRALFGATEWRVTWCEGEAVSPGDTVHTKQL
ncbi:hypothetical protein HPB51_000447 [Rhipicephalus microplus]|uniref:Root UVB sensitive protein C-terminal domain-containing protein n=1 Tax=Rhipicephalus microplus TaxID=6941 RepID=A0A9J6EUW4_RHIMP|nr:hypothetical protein HPB51_000447 [Rhipicephalus microplus]